MSDIGNGIVMPGSGQAEFVARYRAIVFKPFKGEVVDGVVNNVTKVRESTSTGLQKHKPSIDGVFRGSRTPHCFRLTSSMWS